LPLTTSGQEMEQVYSYNPRNTHGAVKVLNFRPVNFRSSPLLWPTTTVISWVVSTQSC